MDEPIFRHVHKDIPPEYKNQPQFICDQCPDIFLNESHLKGHIARKHSKEPQPVAPPKKYVRKQCPHCEKTFGGYNPLQEHILGGFQLLDLIITELKSQMTC